jgi:hypothetical protein
LGQYASYRKIGSIRVEDKFLTGVKEFQNHIFDIAFVVLKRAGGGT